METLSPVNESHVTSHDLDDIASTQ
jgi:hypothetical protein